MKKSLFVLTMLFLFQLPAQAGFLIEPYYSLVLSGKSKDDSSAKYSGGTLGGRLGWGMLGLHLGIDMPVSGSLKEKTDTSSNTYTPSGLGFFISYTAPVFVRLYASMTSDYKLKTSNSESTSDVSKYGIQYTGLPFVAIGIESEAYKVKKIVQDGTTYDASGTVTLTSLVLSAPFDL